MDDLHELFQRTERLQHQVEGLQEALDRLRAELVAHRETLAARLDLRDANSQPPPACPLSDLTDPLSESPITPAGAASGRRALPRRRGNPIPVLIGDPRQPSTAVRGWVLDRSPDGLSLLTDEAVPVGTRLQVRPVHDLPVLKWFTVEVRHCHPERNVWILGCHFDRALSWDDLRLFS